MDLLGLIIVQTLITSSVLIVTALGGMFSEKSGIVNIGLEGMMTFSAFIGATVVATIEMNYFNLQGVPAFTIGIIFALLGGMLLSFLHGYLTIKYKVDQIISGTVINILGLSISMFLTKIIFNSASTPGIIGNPTEIYQIPVLVIIAFLLVPISSLIINKTKWGLRVRACGENPYAAQTMGINVNKIRIQAVMVSGILASFGGVIVVMASVGNFSSATIAGKGFIALAVLIFGRWKPLGILLAGLLFGFLTAFGIIAQTVFVDLNIPTSIYDILPYLLTIVALVVFSRRTVAPEALGKKYNG